MKVCEHFPAIQGEGSTSGLPVYFLRLSGCNSNCPWCDTKYHTQGEEMDIYEVAKILKDSGFRDIIITGGEPMLQKDELFKLMTYLPTLNYHLETNGTFFDARMIDFKSIACSPKRFLNYIDDEFSKLVKLPNITFKFVYEPTEAKWWEEFRERLSILNNQIYIMPLGATRVEQLANMEEVINYCLKNKFKFSSRLHVLAFDIRRGV